MLAQFAVFCVKFRSKEEKQPLKIDDDNDGCNDNYGNFDDNYDKNY